MAHTSRTSSPERIAAGRWLKTMRERVDITQRELAGQIGIDYYTTISQIEAGKTRVPPDKYEAYARALKIEPSEFVRELLKYYDQDAYRILWGSRRS